MNKKIYISLIAFLIVFLTSISSSIIVYKFIWNSLMLNPQYSIKTDEKDKNKEIWTNINIPSNSWLKDLQSNLKLIAKEIWPTVVSIIISKDVPTYTMDPYWFFSTPSWSVNKKIWGWSWFFVRKDWLIITNKHVVSDPNAEYSVITSDNKEYVWKILATDPTTDLAIIKAYTKDWKDVDNIPTINFINDTKDAQVWDFVVAIWNALAEFQNTVTFWMISWLGRSIEAWSQNGLWTEQLSWLIQTDAAINPWNSGWPLINLDWKAVWINTAIAAWANWVWFAIPLSQKEVDYMIKSIEKYSAIKRVMLWIRYVSLNENIAKTLWIKQTSWDYVWSWDKNTESVVKWSNADKAWIQTWDIIIEADSTELKNWVTIKDIMKDKLPWDKIRLKVLKPNWDIKNIEITLEAS